MNTVYMKTYTKGGYRFVECALCGQRFNAGRGGNGAGIRWCNALMNDWWTKHTGQESPEVVQCADEIKLCPMLPEPGRETNRYQVITYDKDGGADEKRDYQSLEDAGRTARGYIDGSEPLVEAAFIQFPVDGGLTHANIRQVMDALPGGKEYIPITISGEFSSAFGFVAADTFDEKLDVINEHGTPDSHYPEYEAAIRAILDDVNKESPTGVYDILDVHTRIMYAADI